MDWIGVGVLGRSGLVWACSRLFFRWIGLDWIGWIGLMDWIGLNSIGLDWIDSIELDWIGLD